MSKDSESNNAVSVCDVMKDGTSKVIKKMESQLPSYVQFYSDTYSEYLHMLDDLYGTCYISEKQFFDKLNVSQDVLKFFDSYFKQLTEMYLNQIDISTEFLRSSTQMRISAIKTWDTYIHSMMDSYAKVLAQYNSLTEK